MISHLFLVCGTAVLTWALRTCQNSLLHRAGTLGIFVTSFLAGWLLGGAVWLGFVFAGSWLLLPWFEILTRIRTLRLPERQFLTPCAPPNAHDFPGFLEITDDVEGEHFEHVQDACWEQEGLRHFYRLFYHADLRTQAAICLIEQQDVRFYYLSMTSQTSGLGEFTTWNYPFSYGMKIPAEWHIQRVLGEMPFADMVAKHQQFLQKYGLQPEDIAPLVTEDFLENIGRRSEAQIRYNVRKGILCPTAEGEVRYTFRGMLFLWRQFLGDLIRLS